MCSPSLDYECNNNQTQNIREVLPPLFTPSLPQKQSPHKTKNSSPTNPGLPLPNQTIRIRPHPPTHDIRPHLQRHHPTIIPPGAGTPVRRPADELIHLRPRHAARARKSPETRLLVGDDEGAPGALGQEAVVACVDDLLVGGDAGGGGIAGGAGSGTEAIAAREAGAWVAGAEGLGGGDAVEHAEAGEHAGAGGLGGEAVYVEAGGVEGEGGGGGWRVGCCCWGGSWRGWGRGGRGGRGGGAGGGGEVVSVRDWSVGIQGYLIDGFPVRIVDVANGSHRGFCGRCAG